MADRRELQDLQSLSEDIHRRTASWPSSMRSPRPGSDLMWELLVSGPSPNPSQAPSTSEGEGQRPR
jgi:hypothetical protein